MRRFLMLALVWALPTFALAASTVFPTSLVPQCSGPGGTCIACDLVTLADNILRFAVAFSVFGATVMFAYAGGLYISGSASEGNIKKAHGVFWNVFWGLVIVIGAWLIVDLSLRVLTNKNLNVLTTIKCENFTGQGPSGFAPTGQVSTVQNPIGGTSQPPSSAAGTLTDEEARSRLIAAGIGIHSTDNCTDQNIKTCTSLEGIPEYAVDDLIALQQSCQQQTPPCQVTVTGGTETGHLSHGDGLGSVDVAFDPAVGSLILQNPDAFGIDRVCTMAGDSQYRVGGCTYNEKQRHLHLHFVPHG